MQVKVQISHFTLQMKNVSSEVVLEDKHIIITVIYLSFCEMH